jgi:hypothetical protein
MVYVIIIGNPDNQYSFVCAFLQKKNYSSKAMVMILPIANTETEEDRITENSKTVYINDSSNLDSIPFDANDIVDEITNEDIL